MSNLPRNTLVSDGCDLRSGFRAFLNGDDTAFAGIYREVNPRLSAYCFKIAPGYGDDLMQELWERVIAMRSKRGTDATDTVAEAIDSPLAFFFRMLKNLSIDHFRRRAETEELNEEHGNSESAATTDLECLILEALEKLPIEDRDLLVLNIYSGYKFGEIAEMQGKSVDAVWARASRARVRLREIVMEDARRAGVFLPNNHKQTPGRKRNEQTIFETAKHD